MNTLLATSLRHADSERLPWIPSPVPGKSSRPLRFFRNNRGFVALLRMAPGVAMPPHRHTGETHAFNLSGSRQLSTGEVIGPGGYVYEPPGNVDSWQVIGDEPLVALVVVMGEVEDLAPDGRVRGRANTASRAAEYAAYCQAHGLAMLDLFD
ncbi:MAG TPA: cupin domain-containing protein [Lysobacter sp.]|nr:cupin domain-containing protein [Lysobacter sp.]